MGEDMKKSGWQECLEHTPSREGIMVMTVDNTRSDVHQKFTPRQPLSRAKLHQFMSSEHYFSLNVRQIPLVHIIIPKKT